MTKDYCDICGEEIKTGDVIEIEIRVDQRSGDVAIADDDYIVHPKHLKQVVTEIKKLFPKAKK